MSRKVSEMLYLLRDTKERKLQTADVLKGHGTQKDYNINIMFQEAIHFPVRSQKQTTLCVNTESLYGCVDFAPIIGKELFKVIICFGRYTLFSSQEMSKSHGLHKIQKTSVPLENRQQGHAWFAKDKNKLTSS